MMNAFDKIDKKLQELKKLTLSEKDQRRLDEKFRLEFNYNSNHIEGNTITYQDAKILLLKDIVSGSYTFRELEEMKAHDAAFRIIKEWAIDAQRDLSQVDIKELNKVILIKNYWKDAQSIDGKSSRKEIHVGKYKDTPNSVRLQNGEMFYYADPIEVPAKMQELIDWYYKNKDLLHPINLATIFHHKLILIHPFDDGNGRIARLLVNYILIKNGFPPIVIKSNEKQKYLNALRQADAGKIEAFINFITEQVEWSIDLSIKAANGESIEDENDWKKELSLLKKVEDSIPMRRTVQNHLARLKDSILPLFIAINKMGNDEILPLFEETNFNSYIPTYSMNHFIVEETVDINISGTDLIKLDSPQNIYFAKTFLRYKKNGANSFNVQMIINVLFTEFHYEISFDNDNTKYLSKRINEIIDDTEKSRLVSLFGKKIVDQIKEKL